MRLKLGGLVAALAAAGAVVVGVGAVTAGESQPPGPGHTPETGALVEVRAKRVEAPRAAQAASAARAAARKPGPRKPRPKQPKLIYLETPPQVVNPGPTGFRVTKCPKNAKAINGYYYLNGVQAGFGLDNQGDSPIKGLREWAFYLDGGPAGVNGVTFGLICIKNVR